MPRLFHQHTVLAFVLFLTVGVLPTGVLAQDATPVPSNGVELAASGLSAPRGFTWGPNGALYVAQSGPGNTADAVGAASSVVRIDDGCPVPVAAGLPSTVDPFDDVLGPNDVQFVGPQLYILQTATGPYGDGAAAPEMPNGIYIAGVDGTVELWLDLTSYTVANPPNYMPGDYNELSEPYRLLADGNGFWLIDANRSLVFFITMDKKIKRIADLSQGHPVLTAMTLDRQGGIYVGNLTPAPHAEGTSWVKHIDRAGNTQTIWTNLTVVTGLALDSNNQLYALEMATDTNGPDGMRPGTGKLVRQTGPDSSETIASGFDFPIHLAIGPDGDFYISGPSYGPNDQNGVILRVPADGSDLTVDMSQFYNDSCSGATPKMESVIVPASATPED